MIVIDFVTRTRPLGILFAARLSHASLSSLAQAHNSWTMSFLGAVRGSSCEFGAAFHSSVWPARTSRLTSPGDASADIQRERERERK